MTLYSTFRIAALGLAFALIASSAQSGAFLGGTVIKVPSWDVLNVRVRPSASAPIIDSYDNGDPVSLIGICKNARTGRIFSIDVARSPEWKYARMKAPYVWCQVLSPNTEKVGWVRGAFVFPE